MPFVKPPTGRELSFFLLISIFIGGLNFGLVFVGLMNAPASVTGIANQLWTPVTLLLAWPLLGERPSLRAILGVAIAFGGVAVAVVDPTVAVPLLPTLFIAGSAAALATGSVLSKRYGPFDPMKLMAWMSLFTVPQVLLVSAFVEKGQLLALSSATLSAWLALSYTILLGGIASAAPIVVVTGAASGIGRAIAELFHSRGARIIAEGINPQVENLVGRDSCLWSPT